MSLSHRYRQFIDQFNFSSTLYSQAEGLQKKKSSFNNDTFLPIAKGLKDYFYKNWPQEVERYNFLLEETQEANYNKRLVALSEIADLESYWPKPYGALNANRVALALIQKVKTTDVPQYKLKCLNNFKQIKKGDYGLTKRLIRKWGLPLASPYTLKLSDNFLGFDHHIRVIEGKSSQTLSSLVLNCYIKGLSHITLVFNQFTEREGFYEALEAGNRLGIEVRLAVSFLVREDGHYSHYAAILPPLKDEEEFNSFYLKHNLILQDFITGLNQNNQTSAQALKSNIERFNRHYLPSLNEGFGEIYRLKPLNLQEAKNYRRLGDYLFVKYSQILKSRIVYFKSLLSLTDEQFNLQVVSSADLKNLERQHDALCSTLDYLDENQLQKDYFSDPLFVKPGTILHSLKELSTLLHPLGFKIALFNPLEAGLEMACNHLTKKGSFIDEIELFNLADSTLHSGDDQVALALFIEQYNQSHSRSNPLQAIAGSDSHTEDLIGFAFAHPPHFTPSAYLDNLPPSVSNLLQHPNSLPLSSCFSLSSFKIEKPTEGFTLALSHLNPAIGLGLSLAFFTVLLNFVLLPWQIVLWFGTSIGHLALYFMMITGQNYRNRQLLATQINWPSITRFLWVSNLFLVPICFVTLFLDPLLLPLLFILKTGIELLRVCHWALYHRFRQKEWYQRDLNFLVETLNSGNTEDQTKAILELLYFFHTASFLSLKRGCLKRKKASLQGVALWLDNRKNYDNLFVFILKYYNSYQQDFLINLVLKNRVAFSSFLNC